MFDLLVAVTGAALATSLIAWVMGFDFAHKPGGIVFLLVMIAAQAQLLVSAASTGKRMVLGWACLTTLALSVTYFTAYLFVARVLGPEILLPPSTPSWFDHLLATAVALGFCGVLVLSLVLADSKHSPLLEVVYIHISNGLYLDIPLQKLAHRVWGRSASG